MIIQYKEEEPDIFLDPAYFFKKSWTRVANMLHFTNALKLNRFCYSFNQTDCFLRYQMLTYFCRINRVNESNQNLFFRLTV